ncbi:MULTISPECIES: hypothetical protein [unclassified Myroides]|uniref:hypothetical protein n=1 Tax=unclassified Myroides TaxID=2642485 RepID=UPI0015F825AA|nr:MULTISPECIES: hypothetical protein [unclassified Myroides]MBB1149155.1 hypothetical protein [Myroides sp. NP-2]MDM1406084.1 hypothetical protein [Myroides sp. DF42-4-2]
MDKETVQMGVKLLVGLIAVFALHYAVVTFTNAGDALSVLGYSIEQFYGFELIFTIATFFALVGIKNSLPNNLGFVFLGFITLRLIASYLFAKKGLDHEMIAEGFKYNFLVIVLVFLGGDAFVAYSILNKNTTSNETK